MEIKKFEFQDLDSLFTYWKQIGREIPYFLNVSKSKWMKCMINDQLDGEDKFSSTEVYLAIDNGSVVGFIQYGIPNFCWNDKGEKYYNPNVLIIRHFFFDENIIEAGEQLLRIALMSSSEYEKVHAFFHIFGVSCNAHHGKLHSKFTHIENLLLSNRFLIDCENIYYVLDMSSLKLEENLNDELDVKITSINGKYYYEAFKAREPIGTAQVTFFDTLTDDESKDGAYLFWIGVDDKFKGLGLGTKFITKICQHLNNNNIRYLHTDTMLSNITAQRFYIRNNFIDKGITRDYKQN
ncbi:GNAT family N-acetyltransferase [Paenibacillus apii]|uniref:GNAT family N-acetyltransferase n=1 Tax=Paenibacillus apii TaxID=1850370 RepID=UPI001438DC5A|nr:GNAT family N-acetyltransferase [Paenibacillus apii]NJJ42454.1 GNAT family N-acetyltransferase [Paenibacillus apii]